MVRVMIGRTRMEAGTSKRAVISLTASIKVCGGGIVGMRKTCFLWGYGRGTVVRCNGFTL